MSLDKLKMIFGFLLLTILAALAACIGLGKVEAHTSYGLDTVLGGLLTMAGGFVQWSFGSSKEKSSES